MTGKIFRSCFLVGLAMMVLCTALFLVVMTNKHEQTVYAEMRQEMCYVRHGLEQSGKDYLTTLTGTQERLTWVAKDGTVLYDSVADPATMENHADRAEIRQAEEEGSGQSKHLSDTLLQKTLYYAVRLDDGTVLRLASVQTTMGVILLGVLQPVLVILILAIVISVLMASRLARQITKPINNIDLEDPRADETYGELFPLVSRLREQNRTIHQQMEALQRRQREFTALAENMNEGVLLLDGQYHILSSNQGAMALLGQEEKPEDLQEDCRREIHVAAGRALAGHHAQSLMDLGEQVIEILANPVIANGQVTGAVILMVNVTEREQRESLRREFSANVSHELKTPLTSISGFAELMKEGLVDPETMQEFAGDIYKECQQLIALVEDIMKLSRLDEGSEDLEQEDVDLYGLARKVLSDLRPIADQRGIALHIEGKGQKIHGVWRILHEMVYNLCENAIKYNKDQGSVTVKISGDEKQAVLSVQDTGIGIPKAQQERVFERFYRVDKSHSRKIGGTGLGLSIVKHGAQFHHARVSLDSEPGVGTTITIYFPKEDPNT